jgi:hypothetical protein
MAALAQLLCGQPTTGCLAHKTFDHLTKWIDNFHSRAFKYLQEPETDDTIVFGPFCARVLLETSLTALVGRIDPFRMLYLTEAQQSADYEHGRRFRSGFGWMGDVIPEKEQADLWHQESDFSKISRALFSRHTDHLIWKPAINSMLDFVATKSADASSTDLLKVDPESHILKMKGRAGQLYSTVSKAVHWEFLSAPAVIDTLTVKASIRDVLLLVGELGFMSHFVATSFAKTTPDEAWKHYVSLRKDLP